MCTSSGSLRAINSMETRCIVKGEAQKSPLSGDFLGVFDFLRSTYSLGIPKKPFNLIKNLRFLQMALVKPLVFTMHLVCTLSECQV